jgi:hypothetical protein
VSTKTVESPSTVEAPWFISELIHYSCVAGLNLWAPQDGTGSACVDYLYGSCKFI